MEPYASPMECLGLGPFSGPVSGHRDAAEILSLDIYISLDQSYLRFEGETTGARVPASRVQSYRT